MKQIGSFAAVLGRVDGIVFTAGIGENDPEVRSMICQGLTLLGIELDEGKNSRPKADQAFSIHAFVSRVPVWVIPADEALQVAMEAAALLGRE